MHSWGWSAPQRLEWLSACTDCGVSSFDHADIYGGYSVEALFGEALALNPGLRKHLQLVSKCGIQLISAARPEHRVKAYDTSALHIERSVEQSLRALRTDYLDTLLLHRYDPLLDADAVAEVFQRLQRAGKVLAFGVSNFTPLQFSLLHSRVPLVTNQVECSPLHLAPLHDGTFDQAQQLRIAPMIWSPLAGGKIFNSDDAAALRVQATLTAIALVFWSIMVFVPIHYLYPSRMSSLRTLTLTLTALWLVSYGLILLQMPAPNQLLVAVSLLYMAYYFFLSVYMTLTKTQRRHVPAD